MDDKSLTPVSISAVCDVRDYLASLPVTAISFA